MTTLNWGMITDGGTFESLVHAVLFHEVPGCRLYGRPGPDAGQDACSQDGGVVYQAKLRKNMDIGTACTVAVRELRNYIWRYRQSGDPRYEWWRTAHRWVLVGNLVKGRSADAEWTRRVVPVAQELELTAELWSLEDLESLVIKYGLEEAFFGGRNRVFVSLKEGRDWLAQDRYQRISLDTAGIALVGRDTEAVAFDAFLGRECDRILPVVGKAGTGKTRFLYEMALRAQACGWRVYWAMTESMAGSDSWYKGVQPGQKTLVAIDEPPDEALVRRILEQMQLVPEWKVVVACRSERDHVVQALTSPRYSGAATPLCLGPLACSDAVGLLERLTPNVHPDTNWAHDFVRNLGCLPLWIAIAACRINSQGDLRGLTGDAHALAKDCLDQVVTAVANIASPQEVLTLLQWIAAYRPLSAETPRIFEFLAAEGVKPETAERLLVRLTETCVLSNWGVNRRFYGVKPDVLADQILADWLLVRHGGPWRPGQGAKRLVARLLSGWDEGAVPDLPRLLGSLARVQYAYADTTDAHGILKPLFDVLRDTAASAPNAKDQEQVLGVLGRIGYAAPGDALGVLRAIREHPTPDFVYDGFMRGVRVTHAGVLGKSLELVEQTARFVTDEDGAADYLNEMLAYLTLLPQEGGEAVRVRPSQPVPATVLDRALRQMENSRLFVKTAYPRVCAILRGGDAPAGRGPECLKAMLKPLLDPERESARFSNMVLAISQRLITPISDEEWREMVELRCLLKQAIEQDRGPGERAAVYWEALVHSHHQYNRALLHRRERLTEPVVAAVMQLLVADLVWCRDLLSSSAAVSVGELVAARELWHWYVDYGADRGFDEARPLALACEVSFKASHDIKMWHLDVLFRWDAAGVQESAAASVAAALREDERLETYTGFFDAAEKYAAAEKHCDWSAVALVAAQLVGQFDPLGLPDAPLSRFFAQSASALRPQEPAPLRLTFAAHLAKGLVARWREQPAGPMDFTARLNQLLALAGDAGTWVSVLYRAPDPAVIGVPGRADLAFVTSCRRHFGADQMDGYCGLVAGIAWVAPDVSEPELRSCLQDLRGNWHQRQSACFRIAENWYVAFLRYRSGYPSVGSIAWLLSEVGDLPAGGHFLEEPCIVQVLVRSGAKLPLADFVAFVRARCEFVLSDEQREQGAQVTYLPHALDVGQLVEVPPDLVRSRDFQALVSLGAEGGSLAAMYVPDYCWQMDPQRRVVPLLVAERLAAITEPGQLDQAAGWARCASFIERGSDAWKAVVKAAIRVARTTTATDARDRLFSAMESTGRAHVVHGVEGFLSEAEKRVSECQSCLVAETDPDVREYWSWSMGEWQDRVRYEREKLDELRDGHG